MLALVNKCGNKKRFSEQLADEILLNQAKKNVFLRKYSCDSCQKFHLTNKGVDESNIVINMREICSLTRGVKDKVPYDKRANFCLIILSALGVSHQGAFEFDCQIYFVAKLYRDISGKQYKISAGEGTTDLTQSLKIRKIIS